MCIWITLTVHMEDVSHIESNIGQIYLTMMSTLNYTYVHDSSLPQPCTKRRRLVLEEEEECSVHGCPLCVQDTPPCLLVRNPTWPAVLRVVLFCLQTIHAKKFFSLRADIYPFILSHWKLLCADKKKEGWKKPLQDALSHGLQIFDSGKDSHAGQSGFWGLKTFVDPWSESAIDQSPYISPAFKFFLADSNATNISSPFSSSSCYNNTSNSPSSSSSTHQQGTPSRSRQYSDEVPLTRHSVSKYLQTVRDDVYSLKKNMEELKTQSTFCNYQPTGYVNSIMKSIEDLSTLNSAARDVSIILDMSVSMRLQLQ
eukprot:TRINITY_DN10146_c0_g1_i1.p1 TRINITY_DN10146_c0_g1~~TRINITY_DN10146_c0_g1_i1.p1  ORF type:complete len:312 (+),score=40.45 TRINITY_DN10146_c0_g1_i1:48-983(+)